MSYTNSFDSKTSNLLQLTEIVTPKKLSKLDILDPNGTTKANQLYRLLTEGKITTEEGLMDALFDKGPHQRGNFNRVKRQLEEKLVNTLFLVESQTNDLKIAEAFHICHKQTAAVKILVGKRAKKASISLAKYIYRIAEKYEFTEILVSLGQELRAFYGNISPDRKKFTFYNDKTKHYSKVYLAEITAEELFLELALMNIHSRSSKMGFEVKIKEYINTLEDLLKLYESYRLNLYAFSVIAIGYEMTLDYNNTLLICDRAINFFNTKKQLTNKVALFTFYFRKISSLILLDKLSDAENAVRKCLELETPGLSNWYKLQDYHLIIFIHSKEYQKAYKVYTSTITHHSFSKQFSEVKELWYIREAYIYYLHKNNIIQNSYNNERLKKFKLSKFLNQVPSFSKDKRGLNISIHILQVLFLLHQKQYGKIIDRTEALRTYTHRYLRRDETFRSNCFIKMLMQLPKANFHRAAVERKTKELREKLSSVGIIQNQSAEVEIVPYEVLWEFVLESLDNKIH